LTSLFVLDAASTAMRAVWIPWLSPRTVRRSNRSATDARPLTRPDLLASMTVPITSAPAGTTVVPSTTIAWASVPLTGSSTLLVLESIGVTSVTRIGVSAGMVTSRTVGAAGALGAGLGAAPLAGDGAAPGAGAEADAAAPDGGGLSREQADDRSDHGEPHNLRARPMRFASLRRIAYGSIASP